MNKELEEIKNDLEQQKKRVEEKINPILQLYDQNKITKKKFIDKLVETFHNLEEEDSKINNRSSI